jgi:hypothetical protein
MVSHEPSALFCPDALGTKPVASWARVAFNAVYQELIKPAIEVSCHRVSCVEMFGNEVWGSGWRGA